MSKLLASPWKAVCQKIDILLCDMSQTRRPYRAAPPPPLPEFRVTVSRPFEHTGVDFAGPLYVRGTANVKVWLCLYTCCTTRAVHLDLVENLDADTFIWSLRRFTSRRGIPARIVSDNGTTFTAAAKMLKRMFTDSVLEQHLLSCHTRWDFNLEKAPWWGGIFERLVRSSKHCLRKVIGTACLSYDELLTVVTKVEAVLNLRPLTYVSSEDVRRRTIDSLTFNVWVLCDVCLTLPLLTLMTQNLTSRRTV